MSKRLEGKVAIVTGAGAAGDGIGNGRAAAILFAREGARVLLVDRKRELAESFDDACTYSRQLISGLPACQ